MLAGLKINQNSNFKHFLFFSFSKSLQKDTLSIPRSYLLISCFLIFYILHFCNFLASFAFPLFIARKYIYGKIRGHKFSPDKIRGSGKIVPYIPENTLGGYTRLVMFGPLNKLKQYIPLLYLIKNVGPDE